jgi:hypothetical protein
MYLHHHKKESWVEEEEEDDDKNKWLCIRRRKMEGGNEKKREKFHTFSPIFSLSSYVYHTNSQEYRHRNMVCVFSLSLLLLLGMYIMPDYILENNIEKLMITQYEGGGVGRLGASGRKREEIMGFHTILFTK